MIHVSNLVFDYPTKRALHGVSISVPTGEVVALVGPNGAGKSTLLRCLAALEEPYSGSITIDGVDAVEHPRGVHTRLGFLPDFFGLYEFLSVRQVLTYSARMHAMAPNDIGAAAHRAATRLGLADRLDDKASELSRGLKQRLAIAMTIVHQPRVLLLDEPAAGLDPDARRALSALILSLRQDGMTIVVSSHILAELEDYCTSMIILEAGRIVGGGIVDVEKTERQRLRIALAANARSLSSFLAGQTGTVVVECSEAAAIIEIPAGIAVRASFLNALISNGFPISDFAETPRTLEEVYRDEVKHHKDTGVAQ